MASDAEVKAILESEWVPGEFRPYHEFSKGADALTVYFRPDPDYSKRLTDHVTVFLALDTHEVVGCRIKGIKSILEDLPNYVNVNHDNVKLSLIFWSFRGLIGPDDSELRQAFNELARAGRDMVIEPTCA